MAKRLEGQSRFGIGKDERRADEATGKLAAGRLAASEARMEGRDEREGTRHKEKGSPDSESGLPFSLGLSRLAPGADGDMERAAASAETATAARAASVEGATPAQAAKASATAARARNGGGPALPQQEQDATSAEDRVDPAMKALLMEVAKVQDKYINGLKQAVDAITGTSETVDGLVGLMSTMVAHQQQLQSDQSAMAQQLAAWARTTQIP
jgi:hypothetical protein